MSEIKKLQAAVETRPYTPLDAAYASIRPPLLFATFTTFFSVVLSFAAYLYMIQLGERVLATRSMETFAALTVLVLVAIAVDVLLDTSRARLLKIAGVRFDAILAPATFDAVHRAGLLDQRHSQSQALRDASSVREFLTGQGMQQLMQVPYLPLFMIAAFLIDPLLLVFKLVAVSLIVLFTILGERTAREPMSHSADAKLEAQSYATSIHRYADVIQALGMRGALRRRWYAREQEAFAWQLLATERQQNFASAARFIRSSTFVGVLALNAWLIMNQQLSPSMLVVGALIVNRGLGPLEGAITQLRSSSSFRLAAVRLRALFEVAQVPGEKVRLPRPAGRLTVENLIIAPPGGDRAAPVLRNVNFDVPPGSCLGVVGPSSAGKSSLARVLVGAWKPLFGTVRLDGFDLSQWDDEQLGSLLGYLPQEVGLFSGTVADNISRFKQDDHEGTVDAARRARVEEMIGMLPAGYNTVLGDGGAGLSGGQRQRIGLARALYGDPVLVVLDEPNANLDASGEAALLETITDLKSRGTTVVFITHKANLLSVADYLITLGGGGVQAYGTREDVMRKLAAPRVVQIQAQNS